MPNTAPDEPGLLHVAVGVVSRGDSSQDASSQDASSQGASSQDESVLIARRAPHRHQGGLLEFPGGKVEPGETLAQALVRELSEEVGIDVDPAQLQPLIRIRHDYGDKHVLLDVWRVPAFRGHPKGLEGQPVSWMPVVDLRDADFPVANRPIIRALRLPGEWLITGECDNADLIERNLQRALPRPGKCGLLLRQPQLSSSDYLALARRTLRVCRQFDIPLILHGPPDLLVQLPEADGIHLSQAAVRAMTPLDLHPRSTDVVARPHGIPAGKWLGVSCHSPEELGQAQRIGADYATLSPVNPTRSHPGQQGLGWEAFARWAESAQMPVYGLGGLVPADAGQCRRSGGQGIAGISHWWKIC